MSPRAEVGLTVDMMDVGTVEDFDAWEDSGAHKGSLDFSKALGEDYK